MEPLSRGVSIDTRGASASPSARGFTAPALAASPGAVGAAALGWVGAVVWVVGAGGGRWRFPEEKTKARRKPDQRAPGVMRVSRLAPVLGGPQAMPRIDGTAPARH